MTNTGPTQHRGFLHYFLPRQILVFNAKAWDLRRGCPRGSIFFFKQSFTSLPIGKFPWMVFWWWGWVVVGGNGIAGNPSQASLSIQLLLLIIILQLPCPNHLLTDFDNISKLVLYFCLIFTWQSSGQDAPRSRRPGFIFFRKCEKNRPNLLKSEGGNWERLLVTI